MIDIPPDLHWLGLLVGIDLPAGNEDALFAIGRAWNQTAAEIAAQVDPLMDVRATATDSYHSGAGADTIAALFTELLEGDSSLTTLAGNFETLGGAAFDFGTTVQSAKLMMIISYALLLVEIAWAWMFPPTAPALEAAAVSGTRSSLRALEDLVVTRIEQVIVRAAGAAGRQPWTKLVVKNLSTYAVKGAVSGGQSVLLDAVVQGGQLAGGTRREFDANQALVSFGSSVLGGLLGRAAGHWGAIGFDASIGRLTNGLGPVAGMARGVAVGAFAGEVSALGGSMASAMNNGDWQGSFSGGGFAASAIGGGLRGGVAGGARGLFQLNRVPRSSASTGFLRHFQLDAEGNVYTPATRAAAAGGTSPDSAPPRPTPVARPLADRSADPVTQQRRMREFDRQDSAQLREYHRRVRESQPQLRATPDDPVPDQPRARSLGDRSGAESVDRQPAWAARMSERAQLMQDRAVAAQRTADRAQADADTAQQRATVQQTRANTEHQNAEQARATTTQAQRAVRDAETRLADEQAAAEPNPREIDAGEQRLQRARDAHTVAVREQAATERRAILHQSRADEFQADADVRQRHADQAQDRADDVRMVRIDRDAIDRRADSEARKVTQPGADENTWWKRALMRSERLGKEYGSGGEEADRYHAKGTDLRGKTRSKVDKHHNPYIAPYIAPTAPDPDAWGNRPGDSGSETPVEPAVPGEPVEPSDPENPEDPEVPEDPC